MKGIGRKSKIRGNLEPHPGWELVELYKGKPVYREKKENLKLEIQLDHNGEEIWVKDPKTGTPMRPRRAWMLDKEEPFVWDEFQLQDVGNGMVMRNRDFRSPVGEEFHYNAPVPSREELALKVAELEGLISTFISGDVMTQEQADIAEATSGEAGEEFDPEVIAPPYFESGGSP